MKWISKATKRKVINALIKDWKDAGDEEAMIYSLKEQLSGENDLSEDDFTNEFANMLKWDLNKMTGSNGQIEFEAEWDEWRDIVNTAAREVLGQQ